MKYTLKTVIYEESTNTTLYSIQRDSDNTIVDIDIQTLKNCISDIDNINLDSNGDIIIPETVKQISVWNMQNIGGKVITGLNDLETYCLKNNLKDKLESYNLGNNEITANQIGKSSNVIVHTKCPKCGFERDVNLNSYITSYKNSCVRCATESGNGAPYCIPGVNDLHTRCIKEHKEYLLEEYDDTYDIHSISGGSDKKVQWKCKYGHTWLAAPSVRLNKKTMCPKCQGSQTSKTERMIVNWLKENKINIIERDKIEGEEFDINLVDYNILIEVNSDHTHSTEQIREKDKHKIEIAKSLNKELIVLMQFCYATPDETLHYDISFRADKKRYINTLVFKLAQKLNSLGVKVANSISDRAIALANKNNVPYERSMIGVYTDIDEYWSPNNEVGPDQMFANARRFVKLVCKTCLNEYELRGDAIKQSWNKPTKGCPYCTGKKTISGENDLATLEPEICLDWHPDNIALGLTPDSVTVHSNKVVRWKCHICGYEWDTMINNRTGVNRTGCPCCNKHIVKK